MTIISVQGSSVPSGEYVAVLDSVEQKKHFFGGAESERIHFGFKVTEGPLKGRSVYGFTPSNPKIGTKLHKFLSNLKGRELTINEEIDPEDFINERFKITVAATSNGKTQVTNFTRYEG